MNYIFIAKEFYIYAYHKNLTTGLPRQTRYLKYIAQFTNDIRYTKGTSNIVAHTPTRIVELNSINSSEIDINKPIEL